MEFGEMQVYLLWISSGQQMIWALFSPVLMKTIMVSTDEVYITLKSWYIYTDTDGNWEFKLL